MKTTLSGLTGLLLTLPAFAEPSGQAMTIHKDPSCGCCTAWADLARAEGYDVSTAETADIAAVKDRLGVPDRLWSCHTVELDGYVLEGHVPFEAVERLLTERPGITGLAVPGMPAGSPGMGDDPDARYDVIAWGGAARDGAIWQRMGASD